jgi:putative RNA 2'-phosphotransferase
MDDVKISRFLSFILRHNPSKIGIKLDNGGWANVGDLITGLSKEFGGIRWEDLDRIVREDEKGRYTYSGDGERIRANQGHSLGVDLKLSSVEPPGVLYHGTATRFIDSIMKHGLKKMSRQYVHLSLDKGMAEKIGIRHGHPVVLVVQSALMAKEGHAFFLSENGVWLTYNVPPKYISILSNVDY